MHVRKVLKVSGILLNGKKTADKTAISGNDKLLIRSGSDQIKMLKIVQ
ncbi:MAG TPA: hypothetical protein VF350_08545 [Candidatus Bathyarchaeia archaeon]